MEKRNRFIETCNEFFEDAERMDRVVGRIGIAGGVFALLVAIAVLISAAR
jgi:hypothetical protein